MSVLERIVTARRHRLAELRAETTIDQIRSRALSVPVGGGFGRALSSGPREAPVVIAELKRASPSEGCIRQAFAVPALAAELVAAGAGALSVLTEPEFFAGEDVYLEQARAGAGKTPLLRKDFIVDPWQIWESRLLGADAVLLMVDVLDDHELRLLLDTVQRADLQALVEAKDERGIGRAVAAGATIIGVNARDLRDFSVDLRRSEQLARRIPAEVVRVAESGVHDAADLTRLGQAGFHAALVGTALMRAPAPGSLLRGWLAAASEATS